MKTAWLYIQILISIFFWFPLLLLIVSAIKNYLKRKSNGNNSKNYDYAIIVTAYQQVDLIPDVVQSILQMNYDNYLIYVVADNCDISTLKFNSDKVILLRPEEVLASNTKSHFYAIHRFKRPHEIVTIIDSDNLVEKNYLHELNHFFSNDYEAVQGVRQAKNLNTMYACLDEAGDIYYRYIDRKILFESGSSASLAGSGMAFTTNIYKDCLEKLAIDGAGFDKVLQYELLKRNKKIAFAEKAIVYDEKTSKPQQLVKQRARWINTWFKYLKLGFKLFFSALIKLNWNQLAFGILLMRPPLFLLLASMLVAIAINIFFMPGMIFYWVIMFLVFIGIFFISLKYFKANNKIYESLIHSPRFIFYQIIAFLKIRKANKISVATEHYTSSQKDQITTDE